jgi:hypothetical protein
VVVAPPAAPEKISVSITPPSWRYASINVRSTAPFVYNKFSAKAKLAMRLKQEGGQQASNKRTRKPKNFEEAWKESCHIARDGQWYGFPCSGLRAALIDSCRLTGAKMTMAKMTLFVLADGYSDDGEALVRFTTGTPRGVEHTVSFQNTTDIACRGMIDEWTATIRIKWDSDQFSAVDVVNLLARAGGQNGIGAGRANSKTSTGQGWGSFEVADDH